MWRDEHQRVVNETHFKQKKILHDFMKAYLADTELKPSEIELVQTVYKDRIVWFFQKKGQSIDPIEKPKAIKRSAL